MASRGSPASSAATPNTKDLLRPWMHAEASASPEGGGGEIEEEDDDDEATASMIAQLSNLILEKEGAGVRTVLSPEFVLGKGTSTW